MFESLFPGANELTIKFLKAQSEICKFKVFLLMQTQEVVGGTVSLAMWNRSPQIYSSLRDSGLVYLPSPNLMQRYKNSLSQSPGFNDNMLLWICKEADRMQIDRKGGLILDEWQYKMI
jgi:hypothetical protein